MYCGMSTGIESWTSDRACRSQLTVGQHIPLLGIPAGLQAWIKISLFSTDFHGFSTLSAGVLLVLDRHPQPLRSDSAATLTV
jgi:hypothetical protein